MADDLNKVYSLRIPDSLSPIDEWLSTYGQRITGEELNRLIHFKNQTLPDQMFIVWCNRALQGRHSGWILKDLTAVKVLWHSLGNKGSDLNWYYINKTLAIPFTDAPVF